MTVPRNFSGTGTGTFFQDRFFPVTVPELFFGTNFFRYRDRYFFPGPIFSGNGTGTFFRDQFFPVPGPVLFSGTSTFFRDQIFPVPVLFKGDSFFPVPVPSKKEQNSRDRDVTLYLASIECELPEKAVGRQMCPTPPGRVELVGPPVVWLVGSRARAVQ